MTNGTRVERIAVRTCIAGGGPAGMMLGFLLARAGVPVLVLEKHADFFRDFRGDTIHPSTLDVIHELGLLDDFLRVPHQKISEIGAYIGSTYTPVANFSHLSTYCKYLVFMPQWDFLDFISRHAKEYASFSLRIQADAHELIVEDGHIAGVRATLPDGALEVRADLVVGADGRHSTVRQSAGLIVDDFGAPMDVMWFRISRKPSDPGQVLGRADRGRVLIMLDRGDYFQCGYLIRKGAFEQIKQLGLPAFRDDIAFLAPFLRDRLGEIDDWGRISLLTVVVDRLRRWYRDGLLMIGDAAHAMSPIGGVGINLAIQDAVAAANILWEPLTNGAVPSGQLAKVQARREFPTRVTQSFQVVIQNMVIRRILGLDEPFSPPWPFRLLAQFPSLRSLPARFIGVGVRPEHIRTPDVGVSRAPVPA